MTTPEPADTTADPIADAAIDFWRNGCSIVPARQDGSKAPIGSWKTYQTRRPTPDEMATWFIGQQQHGFGIVTGKVSGNLECVEVEGRAVTDGHLAKAAQLAAATGLGELWQRVTQGYTEMSPSGGIHWLVRGLDYDVPGNQKIARRPGPNDGVEVLAETRGEGGYIIVAPSGRHTHPSGKPWRIVYGNPSTIPAITQSERNDLVTILRSMDAMPSPSTITDTLKAPRDPSDGISPGDDYNENGTWEELLQPLGWTKVYTQGTETFWRRPGKTAGVSASTGRNDGDNLYVWSTSTTFPTEEPISKFHAYALINHGGDHSTAAKDLRKQGFGSISAVINDPLNPFTPTISTAAADDDEESSWKPVNLDGYLDGTYEPTTPTMFAREDGSHLIYSGRIHSFYGESESGKSWLAQIAAAQLLTQGGNVVYIDFEADAADIVKHLQALGVTPEQIRAGLRYIRPDGPRNPNDPYWNELLTPGSADLVVIDGVTEALTMMGAETKDNDGITRWARHFPRAIARGSGAAVVTIDHVVKDTETRSRFPIGGQAKLSTIDGAAYLVEPIDGIAPGKAGRLTVRVTKDRPGQVRAAAGEYRRGDRTQEAAVVQVDSTQPDRTSCRIMRPLSSSEVEQARENKTDDLILGTIHRRPRILKGDLYAAVKGDRDHFNDRIEALIEAELVDNVSPDKRQYRYILTHLGEAQMAGLRPLDEVR